MSYHVRDNRAMSVDFIFYNNFFRFMSWVGVTPLWLNDKSIMKRSLSLVYAIALTVASTSLAILLTNLGAFYDRALMTMTLRLFTSIMDAMILNSAFLVCQIRRKNWKRTLEIFKRISERDTNTFLYRSRISFYRALLISTFVIRLIVWTVGLFFLPFNIVYLLDLPVASLADFIILLQCVTLHFAAILYKLLSDHLIQTITKSSYHVMNKHLRVIAVQFGNLHRLITHLNVIFGWTILMTHMKCLVVFLNGVNNMFTDVYHEMSPLLAVLYVGSFLNPLVSKENFTNLVMYSLSLSLISLLQTHYTLII